MGVPTASSENLNLTASADYGIISVKTVKNGGARMIGFGFGFDLFQILFTILFVLVAVVIVATIIRNLSQWHKNNQSPRLTVPATVVAKRVNVTHHHSGTDMTQCHTSTAYYATFQVESGDRMELSLPGREYGLLVEGDRGNLSFQGTRFLGFERD